MLNVCNKFHLTTDNDNQKDAVIKIYKKFIVQNLVTVDCILPIELKIMDTTDAARSAHDIDSEGWLSKETLFILYNVYCRRRRRRWRWSR